MLYLKPTYWGVIDIENPSVSETECRQWFIKKTKDGRTQVWNSGNSSLEIIGSGLDYTECGLITVHLVTTSTKKAENESITLNRYFLTEAKSGIYEEWILN